MPPFSPNRPQNSRALPAGSRQRGFALLITITLLAFLVLLLVSLASLTRVEIQVASNNQQLSQARQNALTALNIAIGQLQRATGPDQRTTARADLAEGAPAFRSTALTTPALPALTTPRNGTRYWTSAWGQQDDPANPGWQQTAVLLNWLVSGNEGVTFAADTTASTAYHDGGTFGLITTAPSAFTYTAGALVTGVTTTAKATDSFTLTDTAGTARAAALLVGPATTGIDASGNNNIAAYVVAPLVDLTTTQMPGQPGVTVPIGRYAYWVGDEGVKARADLTDPWATAGATSTERAYGFTAVQRNAIEQLNQATTTARTWDADSLYPVNSIRLSRAVQPTQLALAATTNQTLATAAAKARYHDITVQSQSVLADQRSGGLKRELDRELTSPDARSPAGTAPLFRREAADTLASTADETRYRLPPTWSRLRQWYVTDRVAPAPGGNVTPRTGTAGGTYEISPIMTHAELGFAFQAENIVTPTATSYSFDAYLYIFPRITLWNPYNVVSKGRNYEVGFTSLGVPNYFNDSSKRFSLNLILQDDTGNKTYAVPSIRPSLYLGANLVTEWRMTNGILDDVDPQKQYITFTVVAPDLEPGQAVALSLNNMAETYTGTNELRVVSSSTPIEFVKSDPRPVSSLTQALPATFKFGPNVIMSDSFEGEVYLRSAGLPAHRFNNRFSGGNQDLSGANAAVAPPPGTFQLIARQKPFIYLQPNTPNGADFVDAPTTPPTSPPTKTPQLRMVYTCSGGHYDVKMSRWVANGNPRGYLIIDGNGYYGWKDTFGNNLQETNNYSKINFCKNSLSGWPSSHPLVASNSEVSVGVSNPLNAVPLLAGNVANRMALFEFAPTSVPFLSLAQLQQAHVSDIWMHPAYAIGNSLADYRINRGKTFNPPSRIPSPNQAPNEPMKLDAKIHPNYYHYDISYRLNASLWDRYFFSSLFAATSSPVVTQFPAPNSRLMPYTTSGSTPTPTDSVYADPTQPATKLLLKGGFNVNSTSIEAWRALLFGRLGIAYNPQTGAASAPSVADSAKWIGFSRFNRALADSKDTTKGYRALSGDTTKDPLTDQKGYDQINALATAIVAEVRARGPFVSMADFINRRLVAAPSANITGATARQDSSLKGALQAALDAEAPKIGGKSLNLNAVASYAASPNSSLYSFTESSDILSMIKCFTSIPGDAGSSAFTPGENGQNLESFRGVPGTNTSLGAKNVTATFPSMSNWAGHPGFITQADLLTSLGSALSARSDTFIIRTYGEVLDPVNSTTPSPVVTGRAWCEAVVQRLPDYVDATDPTLTTLGAATPPTATNSTNKTFGRSYRVVSFRWLSPNDI